MELKDADKFLDLYGELRDLQRVFEIADSSNAHFEFVEHYGDSPYKSIIPKRLNELIFKIIKERMVEIKNEIEEL